MKLTPLLIIMGLSAAYGYAFAKGGADVRVVAAINEAIDRRVLRTARLTRNELAETGKA